MLSALDESFGSVLCVAAHPDDLEYGTTAAVARWTGQGKRVAYLLATSGEAGIDTLPPAECGPLREQEERDAAAAVGVREVGFLGFPDGVVEYGVALRRAIARHIRMTRPDVVLMTRPDLFPQWGGVNHPDHRAVDLAAIDAVRDAGNRWVFPELAAQGLQPWSAARILLSGTPSPTRYVDVEGYVDASVASLEAHRVYLAALPESNPTPRELITGMLRAGGEAAGTPYAVLLEEISM